MKYKIAILTQPLELNYGGIIQNYAVQKILKDLGHQPVTIDRRRESPHSNFKLLANRYKTLFSRYFLQDKSPTYWDYQRVTEHNRKFLKKHIQISPRIESTAALANYFKKEKFNAVVVGSDQVWRPKYSPDIFNFYLDFWQSKTNVKKIAFAASFGTEEWEYTDEQTEVCSELIQQFDAVSVRENAGAQLCAKHLKRKDAVHVLDPTLLLEAEDYSQLIKQPKKELGLYTYVLDDTAEKLAFINNCAEQLHLNVHRNQAKFKPKNLQIDKLDDYIIPPLEGWLQGFRDADFVITDSFHGTVFSILNQKPFLVLVNKARGASRFESILSQLGLEDRLIYDVNGFDPSKLKSKIDYGIVNSKLEELKAKSFNFLKTHF